MISTGTGTVAHYLAARLEQLGIDHVFGVPGNYLSPFLSTMQDTTSVRWVGTPTEVGAGYAADAYARVRRADVEPRACGVGVAACTYGVGAFNLLNPIGGAYVEYVPVIVINAAPTYEQWLNYQAVGLLTSHMNQRRESNLDVYRQVTVDAQVISHPGLAPMQIDTAITACLIERRPVYLEVLEDVWTAPCREPQGELVRYERPFTARNQQMLDKAVDAAVELVAERGKPILWAGEEIDRFGLAAEFETLVEKTGISFCTTIGAKSAVPENTPGFVGIYNGRATDSAVWQVFKKWANCRIGVGSWSTSKNLEGEQSIGSDWIVAARQGVSVGASYFPDVSLARFIPTLRDKLVNRFGPNAFTADLYAEAHGASLDVPASTTAYRTTLSTTVDSHDKLTYDGFFGVMNAFLAEQNGGTPASHPYTVVSDAAFALLGSMNLHMVHRDSYVAQNSWLSIGYSVGAATGVELARKGTRPLVFVGNGSFQETCQELSTQVRYSLRPVIFVLDNEAFYGIEQMLVSPCYYKNPTLNRVEFYNVLHGWNYEHLQQVFGTEKLRMTGVDIATGGDLNTLLEQISDASNPINQAPILARIRLRREDFPRALAYKLADCKD
jgi:indolepyruvate decarboxylase